MKLSKKEKDIALQVNSLLTAIHLDDAEAVKSVVDSAEDDIGSVLIGGIMVVKDILERVVDAVGEIEGVDIEFDFIEMIQASAAFIVNADDE